jgi:predicted dehydrogenase
LTELTELNIGIIGAGDFAAQHAQAITRLDHLNLVAACRTQAAALADFTARYGGKAYTDYRDLLADRCVDVVLIATPHHRHTEIAIAAARAGKHILLEKPMAPTLAECDALLQAVAEADVRLMVGHINHFVPAYRTAKALLSAGEMGEIVYAHSTMTRPWMTPNRRDWHLARDQGGGIWLTIGVHVLDQLCWLIDAAVVSISADIQTRFHRQQADDVGVAWLRYANKATATATSIGYRSGVFNFTTELCCTNGLLRIEHDKGVFIGRNESWRALADSASDDWMADALIAEWRAFRDALERNQAMPVSGEYARTVMRLAFAAEQSSQRGAEIRLC